MLVILLLHSFSTFKPVRLLFLSFFPKHFVIGETNSMPCGSTYLTRDVGAIDCAASQFRFCGTAYQLHGVVLSTLLRCIPRTVTEAPYKDSNGGDITDVLSW